jgi:hypothetical protein
MAGEASWLQGESLEQDLDASLAPIGAPLSE